MYWWGHPDGPGVIWVIDSPAADSKSGQNWTRFEDKWDGQSDNCEAAPDNGVKLLKEGFRWLWCGTPNLQTGLGNPVDQQATSDYNPPSGHVQFFDGGVMLYSPIKEKATEKAWVYVLFGEGDWRRFESE
jgi:hypothetical protein